jgi:hypothetical protein
VVRKGTARTPFPESSGEEVGGSPEPNQEPIVIAPIPPYPAFETSPTVDRKPIQVQPYQRPPTRPVVPEKPVARVSPIAPVQPEKQPVVVIMSHPETVTLPPAQEVEKYKKPVVQEPKSLTPDLKKVLTPVKQKAPERMNEKLTNPPQSVNSFETKPLNLFRPDSPKKITKKLKFKGRPGRQRTNEQVVELLTFAQTRGTFPHGISDQMQRYYKREYPEYFRKGRKARKVQAARPAPINISARRSGTGN